MILPYEASSDRLRLEAPVLAIIGTADDGPPYEPVLVKDADHARAVFGDPSQSELCGAYFALIESYPQVPVVLVRLGSERASGSVTLEDGTEVLVTASGGGSRYNGLIVQFEPGQLRWVWPDGSDDPPLSTTPFRYVGELITEVSRLAHDGKIPVRLASSRAELPIQALEGQSVVLSGGQDTALKHPDAYFLALEPAYEALDAWPVDLVVVLGAPFDTPHALHSYGAGYYDVATYDTIRWASGLAPLTIIDQFTGHPMTFHEQWVRYAARRSQTGRLVHAIFPLHPPTLTDDRAWAASIRSGYFSDRFGFSLGGDVDNGFMFSVVAQHVETPYGRFPLALFYAGLVMSRDEQPITGATLSLPGRVVPELSEGAMAELGTTGVVSAAYRFRRQWIVAHGVTAARPTSVWRSMDNVRVLQKVMASLYYTGERPIGDRPLSDVTRWELEKEIQQILDTFIARGVFREARAKLVRTDPLEVDLELLPYGHTQWLTSRVRLGGA